MNDPKEPLLMEHDADGIRELDNKLPRWWVWLFYLTILFSAAYLLYYHVLHAGNLMAAEYRNEMKAGNAIKTAAMSKFEAGIPAMHPSTDAMVLLSGGKVYDKACAAC